MAGSLPEIMGGAGLSFDPNQVRQIGLAIRAVDDPSTRESLRKQSRLRAGDFRWETGARALMAAFDSLGKPRRDSTGYHGRLRGPNKKGTGTSKARSQSPVC
jgi:hypothetical protein